MISNLREYPDDKDVQRVTHDFPGDNKTLLEMLIDGYTGRSSHPTCMKDYGGERNYHLDRSITEEEVCTAVASAAKSTAPGEAKIGHAIIRTLGTNGWLLRFNVPKRSRL